MVWEKVMIDKKLGFEFKDKKLINCALTHPSKSKNNYQRLEFLGDGILDFLVGEFLFKNSDKSEGELTVLRSHFVSEEYLAGCFDRLQIEDELFLGKSLQNRVTRAIKCDIFEAIIAAIYLEFGLDAVRNFIIEKLQLKTFESVVDTNYKTQLQELVQANFKCTMKYETEKENEYFVAKFYMDEDLVAIGYGKDKTSAEQNCAFVALNKLFVE